MSIPVYDRVKTDKCRRQVSEIILEMFSNYQSLSILKRLVTSRDYPMERELHTKAIAEFFLNRHIHATPFEIEELAITFENTINYYFWCMTNIWNDTSSFGKVLEDTHQMPSEILRAYKISMLELHNISSFNLLGMKKTLEDKVILDFGCGSCFLLQQILRDEISIESYTGIDRNDIINGEFDITSNEKGIPVVIRTGDALQTSLKDFDVIWLGEILHGKPDKEDFLKKLKSKLDVSQKIVICELKSGNPRSEFFAVKMLLHAGATDTMEEMSKIVHHADGFKVIDVQDISFYHTAITLEIAC